MRRRNFEPKRSNVVFSGIFQRRVPPVFRVVGVAKFERSVEVHVFGALFFFEEIGTYVVPRALFFGKIAQKKVEKVCSFFRPYSFVKTAYIPTSNCYMVKVTALDNHDTVTARISFLLQNGVTCCTCKPIMKISLVTGNEDKGQYASRNRPHTLTDHQHHQARLRRRPNKSYPKKHRHGCHLNGNIVTEHASIQNEQDTRAFARSPLGTVIYGAVGPLFTFLLPHDVHADVQLFRHGLAGSKVLRDGRRKIVSQRHERYAASGQETFVRRLRLVRYVAR